MRKDMVVSFIMSEWTRWPRESRGGAWEALRKLNEELKVRGRDQKVERDGGEETDIQAVKNHWLEA